MADDYKIGYRRPPEHTRWKKGQSGNPKGRPKSRSDLLKEAAAILSEPVTARTATGKAVSLNGFEASYLALCKKGLKGDVPALIGAIKIMLEVQPAVDAKAEQEQKRKQDLIEHMERLGLPTDGVRERWGLSA